MWWTFLPLGGVIGQASPSSATTPYIDQQTTCSAVQSLSDSSTICSTSDSCCTRLTCSVLSFGTAEFQVLPCTIPPSISIYMHQGSLVLLNKTISDSQDIPVVLSGITLTTFHITVEQSPPPSYDAITFAVHVRNSSSLISAKYDYSWEWWMLLSKK